MLCNWECITYWGAQTEKVQHLILENEVLGGGSNGDDLNSVIPDVVAVMMFAIKIGCSLPA